MGLAYNRQSEYFQSQEKNTEKYKILFTHAMGTKICNDYLIFTNKTGGILQLTGKQFEVMRGQYTVPQNLQKVTGF